MESPCAVELHFNAAGLLANGHEWIYYHTSDESKALAYALFNLQERGKLFLGHAAPVYEGMIVGIHKRQNDLVVNPTKAKQLNNIRAAGTDENLILVPPLRYSLEQSLEFLDDDELLEVTPKNLRLRKKRLTEVDRKRDSRRKAS